MRRAFTRLRFAAFQVGAQGVCEAFFLGADLDGIGHMDGLDFQDRIKRGADFCLRCHGA